MLSRSVLACLAVIRTPFGSSGSQPSVGLQHGLVEVVVFGCWLAMPLASLGRFGDGASSWLGSTDNCRLSPLLMAGSYGLLGLHRSALLSGCPLAFRLPWARTKLLVVVAVGLWSSDLGTWL